MLLHIFRLKPAVLAVCILTFTEAGSIKCGDMGFKMGTEKGELITLIL